VSRRVLIAAARVLTVRTCRQDAQAAHRSQRRPAVATEKALELLQQQKIKAKQKSARKEQEEEEASEREAPAVKRTAGRPSKTAGGKPKG
jgi:hypothetical protein